MQPIVQYVEMQLIQIKHSNKQIDVHGEREMTNSAVRSVRLGDVENVMKIEESSFSPPWEKSIFNRIAKNHGRLQVDGNRAIFMEVIIQNDQVIGYIVWEEDYKEQNGHILNIAITQSERCKGNGKKLLERTLRRMRSSGMMSCELEVRESNQAARYLYERVGMMAVDRIVEYYDYEDAIIYEIIFE